MFAAESRLVPAGAGLAASGRQIRAWNRHLEQWSSYSEGRGDLGQCFLGYFLSLSPVVGAMPQQAPKRRKQPWFPSSQLSTSTASLQDQAPFPSFPREFYLATFLPGYPPRYLQEGERTRIPSGLFAAWCWGTAWRGGCHRFAPPWTEEALGLCVRALAPPGAWHGHFFAP